jgi:8-oxo-dGTP pyrophosphatase MutT (NUDIX family)
LTKLLFDPQIIPVESLAGESAVRSEFLAVDWLRARFANPPDWRPEIAEEHLLRLRSALLLTQRSEHLTDHGGQISLPGGRVEPADTSAIDTALRETEEEVGLDRRHVEVLGTLPDYFTATGYCVTPVVALVQPPFDLKADPFEVAEIFEVPLGFLMDGLNHQRRTAEFPSGVGRRTFYAMPYERFFIWGATAGILRNLFHFLRA